MDKRQLLQPKKTSLITWNISWGNFLYSQTNENYRFKGKIRNSKFIIVIIYYLSAQFQALKFEISPWKFLGFAKKQNYKFPFHLESSEFFQIAIKISGFVVFHAPLKLFFNYLLLKSLVRSEKCCFVVQNIAEWL